MKALVGALNQEKALVGAFSVIVKTGYVTDGSFYSTTKDGIFHEHVAIALPKHSPWTARFNHEIKMMLQSGLAMAWKKVYLHCKLGKYLCLFLYLEILAPCE